MTQNINYKNAKISFSVNGKGTTIVLLHGYLENSNMWQFLAPVVAEKHRVVCIDLLGHGQTDCFGYVNTMADMAMPVNAVLDYLNIKKAVFIGHSMGGYVALAYAKIFPQKINALVLLNSTAAADTEERIKNRTRAIKAMKLSYVTAVRMSIANLFAENYREKLDDEIEWLKNEALKTQLQGIIAAQEGMKLRENNVEFFKNAKFPKLIVLGEKDPVLNFEDTKKTIENTDIKLVAFPDGHMSFVENQEELEKKILSFLTDNKL